MAGQVPGHGDLPITGQGRGVDLLQQGQGGEDARDSMSKWYMVGVISVKE